MGARIALNASPLPVVVTAQKPRRFAYLAGFRFWAITKDVPPSYPTKRRHEKITCNQERKTYCR
jgi:hypothetical protein